MDAIFNSFQTVWDMSVSRQDTIIFYNIWKLKILRDKTLFQCRDVSKMGTEWNCSASRVENWGLDKIIVDKLTLYLMNFSMRCPQ